ncbi:hypothetical protein [Peribacillus simplex]|uniref:hypothetical protein n=1 Tax=Peribacillus simplex TaxID=1478 RepID=UPI0021A9882A|nr:hypothetical protein [Peribacillus simplex]
MKKILTVLIIIMVLTACGSDTTNKDNNPKTINNDYKFIGESEHWEAEYSYKGTELWEEDDGKTAYSNEDSYELILKYKGSLEELFSMKKLEYTYETITESGSKTETYTEPPSEKVFTNSGSSEGGSKVSKDEVIQIIVKWDGFDESFELHNKVK